MLDPDAPEPVVFVAPDGGVYVDGEGVSTRTLTRWRRAHDPEAARRSRRWREVWAPLVTAAACVVPGALLGLAAARVGVRLAGWEDSVAAGALGALVGVLAGCAVTAPVLIVQARRPAPSDRVVPVPSEVLRAAPAAATAAQVWHWSTVFRSEERQRRTIGAATYLERPSSRQHAERAADRYRTTYAEYAQIARALGIAPRAPAVDLDDPFTS